MDKRESMSRKKAGGSRDSGKRVTYMIANLLPC
jgi:hypothetical protein